MNSENTNKNMHYNLDTAVHDLVGNMKDALALHVTHFLSQDDPHGLLHLIPHEIRAITDSEVGMILYCSENKKVHAISVSVDEMSAFAKNGSIAQVKKKASEKKYAEFLLYNNQKLNRKLSLTQYLYDNSNAKNLFDSSLQTPDIENILITGIHSGDKVIGYLCLLNAETGFDDRDGRYAVVFAEAAAVGLHQMQRNMEIETQRNRIIQLNKYEIIGNLLQGFNHDFNNNLQVIVGYSRLMSDRDEFNSKDNERLKRILDAGEKASSLSSQILAFTKQRSIVKKKVIIPDQIESLAKMLRRLLGEHYKLTFRPQKEKEIAPILADPVLVDQAVINVCLAASEAFLSCGEIILELHETNIRSSFIRSHPWAETGNYVRLGVLMNVTNTDDNEFELAENPPHLRFGMQAIYDIMKTIDGFCHITRDEEGTLTRFDLYFPVYKQPKNEKPDIRESKDVSKKNYHSASADNTIIICEDNPEVADVYTAWLENVGYKVINTQNADDMVEKLVALDDKVDLAVIDAVLPEITPEEIYKFISVIGDSLPVLFISGHRDEREITFILENNIPFLQKPVDTDMFLQTVYDLVTGKDKSTHEEQTAT